ncbi:MAG TPA: sigma-70 family RNA polymerase sigma factor, partial [Acidimicrobiales bacterium]
MSLALPIDGPAATRPTSDPAGAREWVDGFAEVFAEHRRSMVRLAYLLAGDVQWAEDAVAEAFAATYAQYRKGRVDDVVPYLRRAVVNQVRGGIRRRVVERRYLAAQARREPTSAFEQASTDHEAIWQALQQLPDRQRAAVVLRYHLDLPEAEAAHALGCTLAAVKSLTT